MAQRKQQVKNQRLPNTEGLAALYDGLLENSSQLKGAVDSVENKCGIILAANIAVLAIVSSVESFSNTWTPFGAAFFILSATIAVSVIARETYYTPVKKIDDDDDYLQLESDRLLLHLIADIQQSTGRTLERLDKKGVLYRWTLIALGLGVAVCIVPHVSQL